MRRLGMTQSYIINDYGQFVCPAAHDVPIRLIMPMNVLKVCGKEVRPLPPFCPLDTFSVYSGP